MTNLAEILQNREQKAKEKSQMISRVLSERKLTISDWLIAAAQAKDPEKAVCLEGLEQVTRVKPEIAELECMEFVISCLRSKAPAVKREAARVLANSIGLYPDLAKEATNALLVNTSHPGTMVRWSAATALSEIAKLPEASTLNLKAELVRLVDSESNKAISKIYEKAEMRK